METASTDTSFATCPQQPLGKQCVGVLEVPPSDFSGKWDFSIVGLAASVHSGDTATITFTGVSHCFHTLHATLRVLLGPVIEVWGVQVQIPGSPDGDSSYEIDGGTSSVNTNVPTSAPTQDAQLFSTSLASGGTHTLVIKNNGVGLVLDYFITSIVVPGSGIPPATTASVSPSPSTPPFIGSSLESSSGAQSTGIPSSSGM